MSRAVPDEAGLADLADDVVPAGRVTECGRGDNASSRAGEQSCGRVPVGDEAVQRRSQRLDDRDGASPSSFRLLGHQAAAPRIGLPKHVDESAVQVDVPPAGRIPRRSAVVARFVTMSPRSGELRHFLVSSRYLTLGRL